MAVAEPSLVAPKLEGSSQLLAREEERWPRQSYACCTPARSVARGGATCSGEAPDLDCAPGRIHTCHVSRVQAIFRLLLTRTSKTMRTHHLRGCAALTLTMAALASTSGQAQINTSLTDKDRAEIQALSVTYREALLTCRGAQYADLFATPGGYFASPS